MKKELSLPVLGIAAGELLIFSGNIYPGLAVHILNLQAIILVLIFGKYAIDTKNVLQSLTLLLLMRIVNLAMPQFFTVTLLWYPFIYGVMYIPVYNIIRNQQISWKELGMDLSRLHLYLPAALLIGALFALLEYRILSPPALIDTTRPANLVLITVVMFVFVGAIEELIFRSILQTRLEVLSGSRNAILLTAALFGIMHSGYGLANEMLFAGIFGLVQGCIFQRTRSFPFILLIHGTANVLLFGILPIISA